MTRRFSCLSGVNMAKHVTALQGKEDSGSRQRDFPNSGTPPAGKQLVGAVRLGRVAAFLLDPSPSWHPGTRERLPVRAALAKLRVRAGRGAPWLPLPLQGPGQRLLQLPSHQQCHRCHGRLQPPQPAPPVLLCGANDGTAAALGSAGTCPSLGLPTRGLEIIAS